MIKKLHLYSKFTIASLLVLSLVCSLLVSRVVHAISDYDNLVLSGGEPIVSHAACEINENLGESYISYLTDGSKWSSYASSSFAAFNSAFNVAQANGEGWALAQNDIKGTDISSGDSASFTTNDSMLRFFVTPDDPDAEFTTNGTFDKHLSPESNTWMVTIAVTNDCTIKITQAASSAAGNSSVQALAWESDNASWYAGLYDLKPIFINYNIQYPTGYAGERLDRDADGDDLTKTRELMQRTFDTDIDTDGDGLNDYIESRWYLGRDDIFCGSECAYPDPVKKDIYVQVDWMKENGLLGRSFKPTNSQLDPVKSAFAAKNINIHFDTGQYGGGDELSIYEENLPFLPTIGETDFFDIKNGNGTDAPNFSEDRKNIWRYLIAGDHRDTASTGATFAGNDDIFVAIGRVIELNPLNQDQAIAGTIIHELGHSLCLSDDSAYSGQDPSCVFAGIDTEASSDYDSSMNYTKQFSMVNYSTGSNGTNDHDDWSAVLVGMDDFVGKADPTETMSKRAVTQQPED